MGVCENTTREKQGWDAKGQRVGKGMKRVEGTISAESWALRLATQLPDERSVLK